MNILVCVKQVPDTTQIKIDPVKHTLIREGVPSILNPFDGYALEAAARVKDKDPSTKITVVTMGPLELGDFIGLDICLAIMDVIYADTGDNKYAASPLLRKMVRGKRLGVKTGIGFYDYSNGPRNKVATDK